MLTSLVATVALLLCASAAGAHVTVRPPTMAPGSRDVVLSFVMPNERDDADTVELEVFFPTDHPLLGVLAEPVAGWAARLTTSTLRVPVHTDDGTVTSAVSRITWTATAGGLRPGQFQSFDVAVGTMPDVTGPLVFKALQTYSSGEVVRWIQVPDAADPTPDSPAPSVTLTSPTPASTSSRTDAVAIAALVCGAVALLGVGALLARRPARHREGADPGPDGEPLR